MIVTCCSLIVLSFHSKCRDFWVNLEDGSHIFPVSHKPWQTVTTHNMPPTEQKIRQPLQPRVSPTSRSTRQVSRGEHVGQAMPFGHMKQLVSMSFPCLATLPQPVTRQSWGVPATWHTLILCALVHSLVTNIALWQVSSNTHFNAVREGSRSAQDANRTASFSKSFLFRKGLWSGWSHCCWATLGSQLAGIGVLLWVCA
ncbi:hypothetical protein B0I73DRAFT_162583 [Yarrowia lipolytica]|uniref:Uncharacterized protein n=1 Tax=Yarrowia lipolytica TaxID=4952 RepID=A0A1D8NNQ6_YARLL